MGMLNCGQGLSLKATNIGPLQTIMISQYCMSLRRFHTSCKRDTDFCFFSWITLLNKSNYFNNLDQYICFDITAKM